MPKTKEQKKEIIKSLEEKLKKQKSVVLIDFKGLPAKKFFELRDKLKLAGYQTEVTKKTLLNKVLLGLKKENLAQKIEEIKGQLALVFGMDDEVAGAKICRDFSKDNEQLQILGGILENSFLAKAETLELANTPSRAELLGRLVGSLQSPCSGLVSVLQGNIKGLITVLSKIKQ